MPIYVVSEQAGLDGYWIEDVLRGLKAEADKKNLAVQNFFLPETVVNTENPIVLAVGYTKPWFTDVCRRIKDAGGTAVAVNASVGVNIDLADATVGFDYDSSTEALISYLYTLKKRKIAFVGCTGRLSLESKLAAFRKSAERHGIEREAMTFSCISELSSSFIKLYERFDAVICSRDAEANHLIAYLKKHKISVPEKIFVVSYGGNKLAERDVSSITSARLDFAALGCAAVKLHRFLSKNGDIGKVNVSVPCPIIVGDSTDLHAIPVTRTGGAAGTAAYRTDNDYMMYLRAEELVRLWDQLDRKIVAGLCKGKNMSMIAEEMFISQSSVKYRVKKMLDSANISDRRELLKIIQKFGLL